ncbi:MAG TPA: hypothetical protein VFP36_00970, partial [Usitatibacter sp.]|nr:hypothetical protein [Usitatibacter sp.]
MDRRTLVRNGAIALWIAVCTMSGLSAAAPPLRGMGAPTRIAAMGAGLMVVSDFSDGTVHLVRTSDRFVVHSFAIEGRPVGVAWARGRIFVGNEAAGRVEAYSAAGQLLAAYGERGSVALPNAIVAVEAADRLFVLDAKDRAVKAYTLDGTYLGALTAPGVLANPSAMGFDAARQLLLVSDFGAFSSSLFRGAQAYVVALDLEGNERGRLGVAFSRPQGVATHAGRLFVVDSFLAQVHVLDAQTGAELGVLGEAGNGP